MLDIDFDSIVTSFKKNFLSSLLTALFMMVFIGSGFILYLAVGNGESVTDIFIGSSKVNQAKLLAAQQVLLAAEARSDILINQTLTILLAKYPTATRVHVGVIHNGTYVAMSQIPLLYYDVLWTKASPGYSPDKLVKNGSLSGWSEYMPDLINGNCIHVITKTMHNSYAMDRLLSEGVDSFVACPIQGVGGAMYGVLFVSWDREDRYPKTASTLFDDMRIAAAQIAGYLQLRIIRVGQAN